ncbi:hypothetical protein Mpsy_1781 [Methanolobus psychrophilus R15]|nr:hypothetical protein Mpsy_1781 [Methanolobus psychrophilus R15]
MLQTNAVTTDMEKVFTDHRRSLYLMEKEWLAVSGMVG